MTCNLSGDQKLAPEAKSRHKQPCEEPGGPKTKPCLAWFENVLLITMRHQKIIACMKSLAETFDSIGYAGIGRESIARSIRAFEAEENDVGIKEYRQLVGAAPNLASALTDLDQRKLRTEVQSKVSSQLLAVMLSVDLLMNNVSEM